MKNQEDADEGTKFLKSCQKKEMLKALYLPLFYYRYARNLKAKTSEIECLILDGRS